MAQEWLQYLLVGLAMTLFFLLLLINDTRLAGDLKNSRITNVLGWGTFLLVTIAVAALLGTQLLELLGIHVFGGG